VTGEALPPAEFGPAAACTKVDAARTPRVGAVVVAWRDRPETLAALESLAAMNRRPEVILCVAQECSPESLRQMAQLGIDGLEVVAVGENLGFAGAANLGMARLLEQGVEWTLLLNNDATADARCLERCLEEADRAPGAAVVGPAVRITDRPDQLWFAGGIHDRRLAFTRHRGLGSPADRPPASSDADYVSGCCALLSSAAWRDVGAFREDFFMYYEDVEWCYRARARGWRCRYVGETLCSHALGVSSEQRGSLGLSPNTAYYLARNPLRFALDTGPRGMRWSRVVGIFVVWGGYNAWRLVRGHRTGAAGAYVRGTMDALRGNMGPAPHAARASAR